MPITVSRLPSGWHAMPVMQRLLGLPSPCSACQIPSLPSSACPPCSSGLRLRREAALLGKAFLSERICMPSRASLFLHFSLLLLVLLLLSVSTNFLKLNGHPWAIFTYSLRDELFPNLVAHPCLRALNWSFISRFRRLFCPFFCLHQLSEAQQSSLGDLHLLT